MKWRGVEVTDLDDDTLAEALEQCLAILRELIAQAQYRKMWGTVPPAKAKKK